MSAESVDRVETLTRERFDADYVRRGRPVVMSRLIAGWPAVNWDARQLARHWPNRVVHTLEYPSGHRADVSDRRAARIELHHLADRLATEPQSAAHATPHAYFDLVRELPELLPELPAPNLLPQRPGSVSIWLSVGRDTTVGAHYHMRAHALLCQIHGRKRVLLFAPEDTPYLYPFPVYRSYYSASRVNVAAPDLRAFPKFGRVRAAVAVLEPGDALFIPIHWWHAVNGYGVTLSASLFWRARWREHRFPYPGLQNIAGMLLSPLARAYDDLSRSRAG